MRKTNKQIRPNPFHSHKHTKTQNILHKYISTHTHTCKIEHSASNTKAMGSVQVDKMYTLKATLDKKLAKMLKMTNGSNNTSTFHIQTLPEPQRSIICKYMSVYKYTIPCEREVKTPLINGRIYVLHSLFIMRFMQIRLLSVCEL